MEHSHWITCGMVTRHWCLRVQSDYSQAIHLLCALSLEVAGLPLVQAINSFYNKGWFIEFQWNPCEGNMVANAILKLSILQQFQLSLFDSDLMSIRPFLDPDNDGSPYRRHAHP
ncbi:hypothetical protein V6N11_031168 [Hibiscus sabdariffa]|uniref:RNase H type-1 domain-containing protein n=2 Tax=Hibiscus sabdariffa TaxID=183260 RepID=A0ABR2BIB2_9ROSI